MAEFLGGLQSPHWEQAASAGERRVVPTTTGRGRDLRAVAGCNAIDFGHTRQLARGRLLTDDFASVDNLLIPVAVSANRKREE
jgi:hypothetical protein